MNESRPHHSGSRYHLHSSFHHYGKGISPGYCQIVKVYQMPTFSSANSWIRHALGRDSDLSLLHGMDTIDGKSVPLVNLECGQPLTCK